MRSPHTIRMTSQDSIAKSPNIGDRWWVPGSPRSRSLISIEAVELSNRTDELIDQPQVPVRQVDLWSMHNCITPTLQPYFEKQCRATDTNSSLPPSPKQKCESIPEAVSTIHATPGENLYLFHCCANKATPALLQSFIRRGPSIRFARPNGYFSRTPAVYWTNSLDFAFAWGVFTATGKWTTPRRDEHFECIIYVSKVNLSEISTPNGMYLMAVPECAERENILVNVRETEWCHKNKTRYKDLEANRARIPPPLSAKADWSIIGSRIPRHTIDGIKDQDTQPQDLPALGHMDLQSTWIYAACDEASSVALAKRGLEILHVISGATESHAISTKP